jgi:hypothetical protein
MPITISRPSYAVDPPDIPPPHKPVEKEEITQNKEVQTSTQTEDNPKNQKPLGENVISTDNLVQLSEGIIEVEVLAPEEIITEEEIAATPPVAVDQGCSSTPVKKADSFGLMILLLLAFASYRWMARE